MFGQYRTYDRDTIILKQGHEYFYVPWEKHPTGDTTDRMAFSQHFLVQVVQVPVVRFGGQKRGGGLVFAVVN